MLLAFLTLLAGGIAFGLFWTWFVRRERMARFRRREPLSIDAFVRTYYGQTGISRDVIEAALQRIEAATDVPAELLRPTDRFGGELAPPRGWEYDDGLGLLSLELRREVAMAGVDASLENVMTVDDYIRLASRLTTSRGIESMT